MSNDSKRKFLKNAALGVPLVIASSSKPAWGAACMSGMMSGNMSGPQPQCNITSGLSPSTWRENFVGSKDDHYKRNDPTSNVLKSKFKHYDGHYCVKIGRRYYFSDKTVDSYFGSATCQHSLEFGTEFMCEIVTARINASIPRLNYVYSINDVEDIYHMVLSGAAKEQSVLSILQQIHQS